MMNEADRLGLERPFTAVENLSVMGILEHLPDFGIWYLTIKDAAKLVALDMWESGDIPEETPENIKVPENYDDDYDPKVLKFLADMAEYLEARLLADVDCGKLEAMVKRNFDDQIIPDESHIYCDDLCTWLLRRGYECNDFFNEWLMGEAEIAAHITDEVAYLRSAKKSGLDESKPDDVMAAYKSLVVENAHLKKELTEAKKEMTSKIDRPVTIRQRRTLLTIIAAICKNAGLDPQQRGISQKIMGMTDMLGAHVDDETIAGLFKEIPDALEKRMK
jgi:hypothetical protein